MRTTLSIDDEVLDRARRRARQLGVSLGTVVEDALRRELNAPTSAAPIVSLPVFRGGTGPRPGVDLASNRSLWESLDDGPSVNQLR